MKNRMGLIVLIVICVALIIALIIGQTQSAQQRKQSATTISEYSNKWVTTSDNLEKTRKVNTELNKQLDEREQDLNTFSNRLTDTSLTLSKTQDSLKQAQDEIAKRDAEISELEQTNKLLDAKATDLNTSITNLQSQIDDTQKKLAAAEGDKAFLQKELQRLMSEKAELERQFNDLKVLRAQVSKLKEELSISRRLEWIRQGIFARTEQKGAQQLMQKSGPEPATLSTNAAATTATKGKYDLNVEVNADGTVKVVPPTNSVPTNPPPAQ